MTYKVRYSDDADKSIAKYKKSNPAAYKKFTRLLKEITEHPYPSKDIMMINDCSLKNFIYLCSVIH